MFWLRNKKINFLVFYDFIYLTQVHNFTVNAQDIFTFNQLLLFSLSLTGIQKVLMQIMKSFVPSYWLVNWLWYRVYNQKVVSSSPRMFFFFFFLPLLDSFNSLL